MARSNRQRKATFQARGKRNAAKLGSSLLIRRSVPPASVSLAFLGPVLVSTILAQYFGISNINGLGADFFDQHQFATVLAWRRQDTGSDPVIDC
jgi:hypothetical protein